MTGLKNFAQMLFGPPQGGAGLAGDPMLQLGLSLMSAGAPSTNMSRDNSWGGAMSQGLTNAMDIQGQGAMNEARREALLASKMDRENRAAMAAALAENPSADPMALAAKYMPEAFIKAKLGNQLDPETRLRMLDLEERIRSREQENAAANAETTTPGGAAIRSLDNLYKAFDAQGDKKNPFGPGGLFGPGSPAANWGINADNVGSMPDGILRQFGDPDEIRRDVANAQLIDKETVALGSALTGLGAAGGGNSATAIDNMNKQLGTGNVSPSVRMKVYENTLQTIIDDYKAKGIELPEGAEDLLVKIKEKNANFFKKSEEALPKVDPVVPPRGNPRGRKPDPKQAPTNQNVPVATAPTLDYMPSTEEAAELKRAGVTEFTYNGKRYGIR